MLEREREAGPKGWVSVNDLVLLFLSVAGGGPLLFSLILVNLKLKEGRSPRENREIKWVTSLATVGRAGSAATLS